MPIRSLLLVTVLLQAVPGRPPEAEYLTSRADVQVMNRQFDAAAALYRDALAVSADYPPARKGLGRVYDLQRQHAEAQAEYQSALRLANEFERPEILRQLAISFVFQRRYADAERTTHQWMDVVTAKHGGERPLGYLDFYELALAKGDFDEAGRVLDTFFASSRLPQTAAGAVDPQAILGDIEWARDQAMRAILAARRGRTDEARTLQRGAEARLVPALKRLQAAAPAGLPANAITTEVDEMMFPAGELAFWLGDTARAIRAMTPMTVKLPRHHLMLGQAHEKEGNLAAARDAYRRIVESPVLSLELAWARPLAEARLDAIGR